MYENLKEQFDKVSPLIKAFAKSKGIDLDKMNIEAILESVEAFKNTKQQYSTQEVKKEDLMPKASFDSSIHFSELNPDNTYTVSIDLPGFNKTNTKINQVNNMVQIKCTRLDNEAFKNFTIKEEDEIISTSMQDGVLKFLIKSKVVKNFREIIIN